MKNKTEASNEKEMIMSDDEDDNVFLRPIFFCSPFDFLFTLTKAVGQKHKKLFLLLRVTQLN